MKCKNCGGDLIITGNTGKCSSCGSVFSLNDISDDAEVFISYTENDENGRRTIDSVLAQEIYYLLEEKKVKTFYKRVSLENSYGNEATSREELAIENAKIIIMVGASADSFAKLWGENADKFLSKKIIPVYKGIDAYDIPKEINSFQALNYERVGASADLIAGVLRLLGRQAPEANDFEELASSQRGKRKRFITVVVIIGLVCLVTGIVLFVLRLSQKNKANDVAQESPVSYDETSEQERIIIQDDTDEAKENEENEDDIYNAAVESIDKKNYADAIDLLIKLKDYKDSTSLLRKCYAKYAGYYYDENTNIFFQLKMYDDNSGIEIYNINPEGKKCTINETFVFEGCSSEIEYADSEGNVGICVVVLNNQNISVSIKNTDIKSDVAVSDASILFDIDKKEDQPIRKGMDFEALKQILSKKTTLGELKRQGYDISFDSTLNEYASDNVYSVDNTDIYFLTYNFDLVEANNNMVSNPDNYPYAEFVDNPDEYIVYAAMAPASIVAQNKIGEMNEPYKDGDFVFYPGGFFYSQYPGLYGMTFQLPEKYEEITDETEVAFCSKLTVGKYSYDELINNLVTDKVKQLYAHDYEAEWPGIQIVEDTIDYYVVNASSNNVQEVTYFVYKNDFTVENKGAAENVEYDESDIDLTEFILPESNARILTEDDLYYLTREELRVARNEIYARHGRIFNDSGLKAYFESKSWYSGIYSAEEFDDSVLNKYERENLQIISEYENSLG